MAIDLIFELEKDQITWHRVFCWWPVRCQVTNKILWLTYARCAAAVHSIGIVENYISESAYLMEKLRGTI